MAQQWSAWSSSVPFPVETSTGSSPHSLMPEVHCVCVIFHLVLIADTNGTVAEFVWSQEEPQNMGAWQFVEPRFRRQLGLQVSFLLKCLLILFTPSPSYSCHLLDVNHTPAQLLE